MSRSNLKPALLISLALHAALIAYLSTRPAPAPLPPAAPPLEWVEVEVKQTPPSPPPERPAPVAKKKETVQNAPRPSASAPLAESGPARVGEPHADAVEERAPLAEAPAPQSAPGDRLITLLPRSDLPLGTGGIAVPSGKGHTLRPDDPSLSKEVQDAEAEHRVSGRVNGFLEDTLSEARAQRGLPHPYFTGVGEAARAGLDRDARDQNMVAGLGEVAVQYAKRYVESVGSYGKSGNPDLGPPGTTPRMSEKLSERVGVGNDQVALRALVQASELSDDLKHGRPLFSLTLEMRQSKATKQRTTLLLKGSGNPGFDAFVLGSWPNAVDEAGPPPPEAFHGPELRSVWAIEGWLRMSKKLEQALSYLPSPGVMGVPLDRVAPKLTEEGYRYEFRARLLRVY